VYISNTTQNNVTIDLTFFIPPVIHVVLFPQVWARQSV